MYEKRIPKVFAFTSFLIALLCAGQTYAVNGKDVVSVQYSDAGVFRKTGIVNWVEGNTAGSTSFNFIELARDEWSVYLLDTSRNVRIQIDLWTNKIRYSDDQTPIRDQYVIQSAQSFTVNTTNPSVDGLDAVAVQHDSNGSFEKMADYQWVEKNQSGDVVFNFVETHRDEWSVYLLDESRNVRIQLDMFRLKIRYSDETTPYRDQYNMIWANN